MRDQTSGDSNNLVADPLFLLVLDGKASSVASGAVAGGVDRVKGNSRVVAGTGAATTDLLDLQRSLVLQVARVVSNKRILERERHRHLRIVRAAVSEDSLNPVIVLAGCYLDRHGLCGVCDQHLRDRGCGGALQNIRCHQGHVTLSEKLPGDFDRTPEDVVVVSLLLHRPFLDFAWHRFPESVRRSGLRPK
jgi:hypothetical protein